MRPILRAVAQAARRLQVQRTLRDQHLASPAFRRWAATFLPTRPIARRRARQLFDLVAGFSDSQVLLACVRLQLFDRLAQGAATAQALSPALQLPLPACQRLLDAAAALRLLQRQPRADGSVLYRLGPLGAPRVGNGALAAMVEHHALLYADRADPPGLAARAARAGRAGALACYGAYAGSAAPQAPDGPQVHPYSALMAASQPLVADEILDAYPLRQHHHRLDLGGGEGGVAASAAQRWPHRQLTVFDLPEVALRAQSRLAALGTTVSLQPAATFSRASSRPSTPWPTINCSAFG